MWVFFNILLTQICQECTFIILDKQRWADASVDEEQCMVGDVNIFLTDPTEPSLAELEVMIAGTNGFHGYCLTLQFMVPFLFPRAQLQRQRCRERSDAHDDVVW